MTGTKDDRDMTGVLYGGVREKRAGKHIITTTKFLLTDIPSLKNYKINFFQT